MNNKILTLLLLPLIFVSACTKDDSKDLSPTTALYNFAFLKQDNPSLSADIELRTTGHKVIGNLPYDVDIEQLVASFEHNGASVTIDNQPQESGSTSNDFTQIVTYTVTAENGNTTNYNVDAVRFTGLPIYFITTNGGLPIDSKEDYRKGHVSFYGGREFDDVSGNMKIRGRGNSTWGVHPKKPYQLKFDDKTEIMDMHADKKWIFLAEHSDKTLMRNRVAFEMGYMSNLDWTPQSAYAEVFVNNEYNGTYHITQKVEESVNRVDLKGTGYLLEIDQLDRLDPDDVFFYSDHFLINIKEPELSYGGAEFNYVKDFIAEFETALFGSNFTNPNLGYEKYINVDTFVDWYLINEITKNQDARDFSSIFMNVVPGEKMNMGPIWDFDLAFGNVNYSESEFPEGYWVKYHTWFDRLFQDPKFVVKVKERFAYYKNNEYKILDLIDNKSTLLDLAQAENNKRWDVLGNWVWPNPVVYDTYQEEVDHLKSWYSQRMNWLDAAYKEL